jgi:glutamate/tyrosine decarboxylase-like PLP-dependent enzyme
VWLTLQQVGRSAYIKMIDEDIQLSKLLYDLAKNHIELEGLTQSLSITTFRYIPLDYAQGKKSDESYLNTLNETLLNTLQAGGEVFLSNAIVNEKYCLRACIVNFRTSRKDIEEIIDIVVREGERTHIKLQEEKKATNPQ